MVAVSTCDATPLAGSATSTRSAASSAARPTVAEERGSRGVLLSRRKRPSTEEPRRPRRSPPLTDTARQASRAFSHSRRDGTTAAPDRRRDGARAGRSRWHLAPPPPETRRDAGRPRPAATGRRPERRGYPPGPDGAVRAQCERALPPDAGRASASSPRPRPRAFTPSPDPAPATAASRPPIGSGGGGRQHPPV